MHKPPNNPATANAFKSFAVAVLLSFISSLAFAKIPHANGDLIGSVDPNGGTSSYVYATAVGQAHLLTDYTDPSGNVLLKTEYDSSGRVIRQTDGLGRQVQITHDTANNIERVRDRNGRTTVYLYDERGNIEEVTDALGGVTKYTYDARDNETSVTDPLGRTTVREFDAYGNVTKETDPSGFVNFPLFFVHQAHWFMRLFPAQFGC